jgi:hypothetical protein
MPHSPQLLLMPHMSRPLYLQVTLRQAWFCRALRCVWRARGKENGDGDDGIQ